MKGAFKTAQQRAQSVVACLGGGGLRPLVHGCKHVQRCCTESIVKAGGLALLSCLTVLCLGAAMEEDEESENGGESDPGDGQEEDLEISD